MSEAELYDFDDMILRVVHAMEVFDELRYNLQEKYQYIMVDEFQDTNMAQMRIVHNLTNHPTQGDTPNICVVGDDDQAIFSFQGADISNILNFRHNYPRVETIALIENYRSAESILARSRDVITQGAERLENTLEDLDKNLRAQVAKGEGSVQLIEATSSADERHILIANIKKDISSGIEPSEIAVLTRKHDEIEKLLPYFVRADIAVAYERQDNVLNLPPIVLIEQLSRVLIAVYNGQHAVADGLLPQVLAHPAWAISPVALWQLSLTAFTNRSHWLDEMAKIPEFIPLHTWLITTALSIPHTPLETILDHIVGAEHPQTADDEHDDSDTGLAKDSAIFTSPLYSYFFSDAALTSDAEQYIRYLEALRAIRTHLRDYRPLETPSLISFITFITLHRTIGSGITSIKNVGAQSGAVQLMTAHKSKGLEFDSVYIVGAVDSVWGERARSHSRSLSYPENLALETAGNTSDERLRLFYVAATRAKKHLTISYAGANDGAKATDKAAFLVSSALTPQKREVIQDSAQQRETAELRWYEHLTSSKSPDLMALLAPQLQDYMLSVTHLTNFLDVTRGGPQNFLLQNLLRFPQAMSPASAYGSAIHSTLQRAHSHFATHNQRQAVEDILRNFETSLAEHHLSEADFEKYLQKGSEDLHAFLGARYNTFKASQRAELNFKSQHVVVGEARLSGALDLVDIAPDKSVIVTDYKTGKPLRTWTGKTDYEKIKLHKYKQQLMFYKLLIENARDFRSHSVTSGVLQFIEPTSVGNIIELEAAFSSDELEDFARLINAVWKRIITLDLPDISGYDSSLKGILAFEHDLVDETA
jgi:DNA helicase-2/ATP-dependent DNA helicase PcrA